MPGVQPALGEPLKFHPKAVPPRPDPEYVDRINIVDRGLNSDFAIGAGTILVPAQRLGPADLGCGLGDEPPAQPGELTTPR